MKLLILSDLHLDMAAFQLLQGLDFDVAILAGDIHDPGHKGIAWARDPARFGTTRPVLIVPGNHEYYGCVMTQERDRMREAAAGTNVHLLDGDEVVIDGVRFLGCTLWTDFALPIQTRSPGKFVSNVETAMQVVSRSLNDYNLIGMPDEVSPARTVRARRLTADDTLGIHVMQRAWLQDKLAEPFDGHTVVVTHHAPRRASVAALYAADMVSAGFASDLPDAFFEVPVLWVHGHVHDSVDYHVGTCRVIVNLRGYVNWQGTAENRRFDPGLVIDLDFFATRPRR